MHISIKILPRRHFDRREKSPRQVNCSQEISQFPINRDRLYLLRNDGEESDDGLIYHHHSSVFSRHIRSSSFLTRMQKLVLFLLFLNNFSALSAQNTMYINDSEAMANDTALISLAISNDTTFISFQCDVVLPEGFTYIPETVNLTGRSSDHVINAVSLTNNTLRLLSYSLSNTVFLSDTGTVATFKVTTPPEQGNYKLTLHEGIIGNAESVNILDTLINGTILLKPLGVTENRVPDNIIHCYPNPFTELLHIDINLKDVNLLRIETFDASGRILTILTKDVIPARDNHVILSAKELLGNSSDEGYYFIHVDFKKDEKFYRVTKKIMFKR